MHILLLTDNFPPEVNAPASRCWEHARIWVGLGARVTVITSAPNFPQGVVHTGYRNRWTIEELEGVAIHRVPTFIVRNEGFVLRTLDFLSFMLASFIGGLRIRAVDLVIATSPQFFTACSGWALSRYFRAPFVFEIRDLWPASITAVGMMRGGRIIGALERLEIFLYRQARGIITVTKGFRDDLIRRGIPANRIAIVTNGADLSRFHPRDRDEGLAGSQRLAGKFVIGYLGTHGMAHGLDNVILAADRLRDQATIRDRKSVV